MEAGKTLFRCCFQPTAWLHFVEGPMNVTSSLGKPVAVRCVLRADGEGQGPQDVLWLKEGQPLQMQFPEDENGLNKTSSFSCEAHNRKGVASSGSGVVTDKCPVEVPTERQS